jgi:hypothetical protein
METQQLAEITAATATMEWQNAMMTNVIRFVIITGLLIVEFVILVFGTTVAQIGNDWPRYRCKPYIMPLASLFGHDSAENFQFCMKESYTSESSQSFAPLYAILSQFTGTVGIMVDTANGMRQLLGNFMTTTKTFVWNVKAKIDALLFQLRLSFLKMQTLMNRVYGTMYSIVWMGTSALTAGTNLSENDLVKFLFEFCFHPDTIIRMADGVDKRIADIRVGDTVTDGLFPRRVISTFRFNGFRTPMVRIGRDILSAKHLVRYPNATWGPAEGYPDAIPVPVIPELVCLNVEGHRFVTAAGLLVADYDESESPNTVLAAQLAAQGALNGGASATTSGRSCVPRDPLVANYALGVDPTTKVELEDSTWIPMSEVEVGERLYGGLEVVGVVEEETEHVCSVEGIHMTPAQLVWYTKTSGWNRAIHLNGDSTTSEPQTFRQVITATVGPIHVRKDGKDLWIRDYREAPLPEMEDAYLEDVCNQ